jgi:hypothetical protein
MHLLHVMKFDFKRIIEIKKKKKKKKKKKEEGEHLAPA